MIAQGGTIRAEAVSSREALASIDSAGGLSFSRRVEDFWRIKVDRTVAPSDLVVRYQVTGGDERSGTAVHRSENSQSFPVRLVPMPPRILCENSRWRVISGGFTAQARASGIGLAGLYALEIEVDVQER